MSGQRGIDWIGAGLLRVRWFARAPIFGYRLLMLEHVGRNTRQRRFVVLEVVDHPTPDRYVVVSGFGTRAQWFRNVEANPQVRVYLASHAPAPATGPGCGDRRTWPLRPHAPSGMGKAATSPRGHARNQHRRTRHRTADDRPRRRRSHAARWLT